MTNKMQFRLGRSIATIVPFIRYTQQPRQQPEDKPLITNKLIIIMAIVAVIKVAILLSMT